MIDTGTKELINHLLDIIGDYKKSHGGLECKCRICLEATIFMVMATVATMEPTKNEIQ